MGRGLGRELGRSHGWDLGWNLWWDLGWNLEFGSRMLCARGGKLEHGRFVPRPLPRPASRTSLSSQCWHLIKYLFPHTHAYHVWQVDVDIMDLADSFLPPIPTPLGCFELNEDLAEPEASPAASHRRSPSPPPPPWPIHFRHALLPPTKRGRNPANTTSLGLRVEEEEVCAETCRVERDSDKRVEHVCPAAPEHTQSI